MVNVKIFETPHKFIIAKLSIRKLVSFVIINLCGVSTKLYFSYNHSMENGRRHRP